MKRFFKKILIFSSVLAIFTTIPTGITNYIIDPYGLIGEFSDNYKAEPNMRSLKNWFVLENKSEYNNLFFSNSRGGTFVFKDSSYYNMSYSMGVPKEFYNDIETLIANNVDIKSVIIMIDDYSIFNNSPNHINNPLTRKYNRNDFISFLNIPLSWAKISSVLSFNKYDKHVKFNVKKNGSFKYNNFNIDSQVDTLKTNILNKAPTLKTQNVFYELKEIITSLRSKKIDVYIGVHPISKKNYEGNVDNIRQLKSLINLLNKNNINLFNKFIIIDDKNSSSIFYDRSHYSPILAQKVIGEFYKFRNKKKP